MIDRPPADAVPAFAKGVRLRHDPVRAGWMLLGPEKVLQPDEITAAVLQRIDGQASLGGIAAALADAYEGDPAEIHADVADLMAALWAQGWIELR